MTCKCYHAERNFLGKIGVCWGQKSARRVHAVGMKVNVTSTKTSAKKATPKPLTNADLIRLMTDEELAEVLCLIAGGLGPVSSSDGRDWLEWLKRRTEND